jgi:hypothetical protein
VTKAILAALLAASSILPGVASAQDGPRGGDRPQLTDQQRQARAERRAERQAARGAEGGPQARGDRGPRDDDGRGPRGDGGRDWQRNDDRDGRRVDADRNGRFDDRGGYQRAGRDARGQWDRRGGYDARYAAGSAQRWSNDWRRDGRYDWNRYRSYNRSAFRLPRYYAPGGWGYGYRRFSIGARIAAPLFARNYWISDPWAYRLPAAYGPYRWVRYYNDAVLVDLRTGSVVDSIYGIFW